MRKKLIAIILFVIIASVSITSIMSVHAIGQGEFITKYRVEDLKTGQLIMEKNFKTGASTTNAPLFAGAELNVTFTIEITIGNSASVLKISTNMQHSTVQDRFWELLTPEYDLTNYNPNQAQVFFAQATGNLTMSCFGKIPQTIAGENVPVEYTLVQLTSPNGEVLDQIKPSIVSAALDEYNNLLKQKQVKLQSLIDGGVASGYIQLYTNVLNQSQVQADDGEVEHAIALLNSLPTSNEPVSTNWELLFYPAVGGLAALVVVFALVFMRARGKNRYTSLVVEDQIKDLEGLILRTSKLDRTVSSNLETINERLKRLVGA